MKIKNLQQLNNIIKNEIKPYIIDKGNHPYQYKLNQKLFKEINNKYENWFEAITELIYLCNNINNLENCHIYCICGNKNHSKGRKGYTKYCCVKCEWKDENYIKKYKNTMLKRYNVDNAFKLREKQKQTKKLKYNDENYNNRNKAKQTWLNKYGVDNPCKNKEIKNKRKLTCLQKYGKEYVLSTKQCQEKAVQTCYKKYGVSRYSQTQQYKNLFKNYNFVEDIKRRVYNTKKKNNSFKKSKQEDQVYNYLLQKFNKDDIERQYKSKLYPFNCDFYIKSLNLYIECNFTWTHYKKPFKNSVEDLIELEKLKNKNTQYYNSAINVWTKRDPLKLSYFKKNKLNYKIFYRIEQFLNWYSKI